MENEEKKIFRRNVSVINAKIQEVESRLPQLQKFQEAAKALGLNLCDRLLTNPRAYIIHETKANVLSNGNMIADSAVILSQQFRDLISLAEKHRDVSLSYYDLTGDVIEVNELSLDAFERQNTIYLENAGEEKRHDFAKAMADLLNEWNTGAGRSFGFGEISNFGILLNAFLDMVVEVNSTKPWTFKPNSRFVKSK